MVARARRDSARAVLAVTAPPAAQDIRDATLVKDGDLFVLSDLEGNIPSSNTNGFGVYYRDTRVLSAYDLAIQGLRPTVLLSSGRWHFLGSYVLTNPNLVAAGGETIAEQTVQIRRYRVVRGTRVSESLAFQNFNAFPLILEVAMHVDADFADIFDVRGMMTGGVGAREVRRERTDDSMRFSYDGRDGVRRTTTVTFDPPPASLEPSAARYRIELGARAAQRVAITIDLEEAARPASAPSRSHPWVEGHAMIETSNAQLNAVLAQSRNDLRVLLSGEGDRSFVAAGIPWYAALFGRDAIWTALEDLWITPKLARHTLTLLAEAQGTKDAPSRDEEPGKILHEHRRGELARAGIVPFGPYYGSVDTTPLWIVLLGAYYRATADLPLVRELASNLERALAWIDRYGDSDGDGFVEYKTRATSGLVNQGWKDSWDGIVHADGTLAAPPIALVEVQGYVFSAKRHAATLYRALGDSERAERLEAEAVLLQGRFERAFWMPDERYYCVALDGAKRQVASITSNPGHALLAGIVSTERAASVIERLLSEDMFSGYGIRTLSTREARYNPLGYHVGTVWPHDNAIAAAGFKRYGAEAQAIEIASGLFAAAEHFPSFRLPELFCGFARSAFGVPVRYPVACSPQAWAATSTSMLVRTMLGLLPDGVARELLIVRPRLPSWLDWVTVQRVPVADGEVDLRYERAGDRTVVDVVAMRGGVRVSFVEHWPG